MCHYDQLQPNMIKHTIFHSSGTQTHNNTIISNTIITMYVPSNIPSSTATEYRHIANTDKHSHLVPQPLNTNTFRSPCTMFLCNNSPACLLSVSIVPMCALSHTEGYNPHPEKSSLSTWVELDKKNAIIITKKIKVLLLTFLPLLLLRVLILYLNVLHNPREL